jgi:hypothetical protein
MGVVAGHLKTGGNQALGTTSHAARLVRATFADGTERPAAKRSKAERAQARLRLLRHPGRDFLAGTFAHACGCARPALQTLDMVLLRCWFGWNARVHAESQQRRACTIKMGTDPLTPYDVLGLENGQGDDVAIKRAYKRAMIIWHPDKNMDNEAEATEKTKPTVAAYECIGTAGARRKYEREQGVPDQPSPWRTRPGNSASAAATAATARVDGGANRRRVCPLWNLLV